MAFRVERDTTALRQCRARLGGERVRRRDKSVGVSVPPTHPAPSPDRPKRRSFLSCGRTRPTAGLGIAKSLKTVMPADVALRGAQGDHCLTRIVT
jgi:hypothetical protein